MVITSCVNMAVSGFGDVWLLGGNVLCKILMAWWFCRIAIHETYLSVPSHHNSNLCLSRPTGFPLYYILFIWNTIQLKLLNS